MGDNKNMILAVVFAIGILLLYQIFVIEPMQQRERDAAVQRAAAAVQTPDGDIPLAAPEIAAPPATREDALERDGQRIRIEGPAVSGSLVLSGARIDDLVLLRHAVAIDDDTPVTLLNPRDTPQAFFAQDGWLAAAGGPGGAPGRNAAWSLVEGRMLTPTTPVVLEFDGGEGLVFRRRIELDDNYMFTLTDTVTNNAAAQATLQRYGEVRRDGIPADFSNFFILFEGPMGVAGDTLVDEKYNGFNAGQSVRRSGTGGWVGISDKYWLAAVIPDQAAPFDMEISNTGTADNPVFRATYRTAAATLAPGETMTSVSRLFAGAKEVEVLRDYQNDLGISRFDMAIDWGMFWFLTRPYFAALHWFAGLLGNFGLAILAVTVVVKLIFFPLANKSYESMAKMKVLAPKMKEIRERFADDKQKQQQEIIALYQREKANPLAGCLPILVQIPVFYALYKTLFVTLEMRHQPFFGWIQDLSAPDPTNMWNLFGLLPYDPGAIPVLGWVLGGFLAIGLWPIFMGITMWAQQALNPPPPDPMQARIFAFMPILFTIILAPFAAGLVIYWAWNSALSVLQQYVIMRRQGVETQFDKLVKRVFQRGGEENP